MNEVVRYEKFTEEHVAVLRIDRPEASNAINTAVMEGLAAGLLRAKADDEVRVLIITGTGDRTFVAGGDLKEFHAALTSEDKVFAKMTQMRAVLEEIAFFPKPVIAAINGAARGGGGELASACHFRVMAEHATVGYVQVKLGIAPGWGGGVLLQRIVGAQKARWLVLSGDVIGAAEAKRIGYVDEVIGGEDFSGQARAFARKISGLAPNAVQGLLERLRQSSGMSREELAAQMEAESRLCAKLWMEPAHREAIEAFEKRKAGKAKG
jgi:enoyl-CoA hydratase/carnithine racemase